MSKRLSEAVYDHSYRFSGKIGDPCVYCGQPSDTYDHVPPLHFVQRTSELDLTDRDLVKYPACKECNSFLTGLLLMTILDRRKHVKGKLRKRYKSFLKMPVWDQEELDELEPRFADDIKRASRYAEFIKARVAFRR